MCTLSRSPPRARDRRRAALQTVCRGRGRSSADSDLVPAAPRAPARGRSTPMLSSAAATGFSGLRMLLACSLLRGAVRAAGPQLGACVQRAVPPLRPQAAVPVDQYRGARARWSWRGGRESVILRQVEGLWRERVRRASPHAPQIAQMLISITPDCACPKRATSSAGGRATTAACGPYAATRPTDLCFRSTVPSPADTCPRARARRLAT